ncbi:alpha-1,2-fucosyltransferase [Bacteroides xylanisolvens]|uniref:alpha-1,2-fucosyltransferase n=1 Tax=Bacteroides xylanisolvens TaxID=371601 RepID=UPI001F57259D|nr:alpha-1,2-fucosyltransferase [Bacteroides xylanisolvens]
MMKLFCITTGGGLGNQIMSYSLWLYLKRSGFRTVLYLRKNHLERIFDIKDSLIKKKYFDFFIYLIKRWSGCTRFFNKVFGKEKNAEYSSLLGIKVVDYPEWGDYKFINEILPELKKKFSFPKDDNENNVRIINMMQGSDSVSVHVRRGDYQNSVYWRIILGDICDTEYYEKAIEKAYSFFSKPTFFVFSDDIEWVKSNLYLTDPVFVDWNKGEDAFRDIQLMSYCKMNIIANSTFSLCASWLNVNIKPIRIVPSKWLNSSSDNLLCKYIPSDWIVIDNSKPTISIISNSNLSEDVIRNILKQRYSDFELILNNNDTVKFGDDRIKTSEINGRYVYNYLPDDSLKFRNRNYLWNWLSEKYTNELYG